MLVIAAVACGPTSGQSSASATKLSDTPTAAPSLDSSPSPSPEQSASPSRAPSPSPPPTPSPPAGPLMWAAPEVIDRHPQLYGQLLSGVSCPSTSLCVAVDRVGNVVTSSNPTGGASTWTTTNVDGTDRNVSWLEGVSCPTDNLCVAVDGGSNVLTSTDPTGGAAAWKVTHVDEGGINLGLPVTMTAVSCSRTDLCVAVDSRGNIVTSINPAGGAAQWSITKLDPYSMSAVSCVTSGLCVVVDNSGRIFTSTNPTGGAAAWKVASVDINQGMGFFLGVSAPATLSVWRSPKGCIRSRPQPLPGARPPGR